MNTDSGAGTDFTELVSESDINVPVRIFHQFAHFSRYVIANQAFPFCDKAFIKIFGHGCSQWILSADNTVIVMQLI